MSRRKHAETSKEGIQEPTVIYGVVDISDASEIENRAKKLQGMTFNDVLDLGIYPPGVERKYNDRNYKGGLGTLVEERYFGYKANNDQRPDFPEAGVELKTTCFDVKKNGEFSAGERLSLTMIPFDEEIEKEFEDSHLWDKASKILLVYYERNRALDPYEQKIHYVTLFTPPDSDLEIIKDDYKKISDLIKNGEADKLSESLTMYLGAATKGATAEKSLVDQHYAPGKKAKKRVFSFKRQYMDYILHHYVMREDDDAADSIVKDASELSNVGFEEYVLNRIRPYIGKSDRELCCSLGIEYSRNKAQWTSIVYKMLGITGNRAEEFEKANISVRTVRIEERGKVRESLSLHTINFKELVSQTWEDSDLRRYFDETRFLFVSFKKCGDEYILHGARFWAMPVTDLDGSLCDCWNATVDKAKNGVRFKQKQRANGKVVIENDLPSMADNPVAHVRPHAAKSAYKLHSGFTVGDIDKNADQLPDGQYMTTQSFWLNSDYIYRIVEAPGIS